MLFESLGAYLFDTDSMNPRVEFQVVDFFFEKTCSMSCFFEIEIGQNYLDSISIPPKPGIKMSVIIPIIFRLNWFSQIFAEIIQGG